jgi:hypothetical protein
MKRLGLHLAERFGRQGDPAGSLALGGGIHTWSEVRDSMLDTCPKSRERRIDFARACSHDRHTSDKVSPPPRARRIGVSPNSVVGARPQRSLQ